MLDNCYGWFWFGCMIGGKATTFANADKAAYYYKKSNNDTQAYQNGLYSWQSGATYLQQLAQAIETVRVTGGLSPDAIAATAAANAAAICRDSSNTYSNNTTEREQAHHYDCSSLVSRVYYDLGMTGFKVNGKSRYTETLFKLFNDNACIISINCVDESIMKPGDVILSRKPGYSSYINDVNHAAMYIGNGQIAEAVGPAHQPNSLKISKLYSERNGVPTWIVARPTLMLTGTTALSIPDSDFVVVTRTIHHKNSPDTYEQIKVMRDSYRKICREQ